MASTSHICRTCAVALPVEDGHDRCIAFLGYDHALKACDNPSTCMDCSIMPLCTREAHFHFFWAKHLQSPHQDLATGMRRVRTLSEDSSHAGFQMGDHFSSVAA